MKPIKFLNMETRNASPHAPFDSLRLNGHEERELTVEFVDGTRVTMSDIGIQGRGTNYLSQDCFQFVHDLLLEKMKSMQNFGKKNPLGEWKDNSLVEQPFTVSMSVLRWSSTVEDIREVHRDHRHQCDCKTRIEEIESQLPKDRT